MAKLPDATAAGLRFHDIRGTTISRLLLAGCSDAEVAAISGHAIARGSMLEAYAQRARGLALHAYRRWWHAMRGGQVVPMRKPVSSFPETA